MSPAERPYVNWQHTTLSEEETARLGAALADALEPGTIVALAGNLGAGKTRFVQAVAAGLGVDRRDVSSPTFILIQEYDGRLPMYHIDAYRLGSAEEFLDLGVEEIFAEQAVCFIEWADRVAAILPEDRLRVEIDITGSTSRRFRFEGRGRQPARVVSRLRDRFRP